MNYFFKDINIQKKFINLKKGMYENLKGNLLSYFKEQETKLK